jgi:O-succinylhomoserine sulfhydrylase
MRQQGGVGGAVISFDVGGASPEQARSRAFAVLDHLQVLSLSTNLGDTKSLVAHPASTSHGRLSEEQRQAAGISQGLIRIAVGLEHLGDIQADLERGLASLA